MTEQDRKVWERIGSYDFVNYCKFKLFQIKKEKLMANLVMETIEELYKDYKKKKGYK